MKNRKIKVRVWLKPLERFLTKDEWFLDFDGDLHFIEYDEDSNQYWPDRVPEENYVVQQYTGLKDSKGKEIYEGDVVKIIYDKAIGEVYFDFNLGAFRLKDKSSKSYPITTYRFDEVNKPIGLVNVADEVIGNIFENSELLKQ